jgi:ADP-ribose pyrophosphatase YjhB (NUDIX family)
MSERAPGNSARPLIAAGVLFLDEEDRVLLVNPSYKPGWEIPGGYVEAGESPLEASIREVKEELGIAPSIGSPLVVDWAPHPDQGDKLLFIFDGGILDPGLREQVRLAEDELTDWQFHGSGEIPDLLIPRLARRVHQAVAARRSGQARYLQHGAPA